MGWPYDPSIHQPMGQARRSNDLISPWPKDQRPALRYRADVRKRREEARKEKERIDKESKEPNHVAHEAPDEVPWWSVIVLLVSAIPAPADWVSYGIISIIRFWAYYLVGGLDNFLFFHILGIIIPTDFHIFQRGWNHQPAIDLLDSFNMLLHPLRFIFRIVGKKMSQTWIMDDYGLSKSWLADVSRYVWKAQLTDLGTNFLSIVIVFAIKHHVFVNIVFFCIAVIRNGKNFAYFLWCPKTSLIVSYLPIFFPYFSMVIHG